MLALRGFSTTFSARCAEARNEDMQPLAARLGIAPWHLAMLSAGLAILEVGVGERAIPELQQAEAPAVPNEQVEEDVDEVPGPHYVDFIQETHVVRAFSLLALLEEIRSCWQSEEGRLTPELRSQQLGEAEECARLLQVHGPPVSSDTAERAGLLAYAPTKAPVAIAPPTPSQSAPQHSASGGADANTDTRDRAPRLLLDTDDEGPSQMVSPSKEPLQGTAMCQIMKSCGAYSCVARRS